MGESDDDHDDDHGMEAEQNSTENNNSEVPKVSIVGHYHVCFISYQLFRDILYFLRDRFLSFLMQNIQSIKPLYLLLSSSHFTIYYFNITTI